MVTSAAGGGRQTSVRKKPVVQAASHALRRISHGPPQPTPPDNIHGASEEEGDPDFTPVRASQIVRKQRSLRMRRPLNPDENAWKASPSGNARLLALADEARRTDLGEGFQDVHEGNGGLAGVPQGTDGGFSCVHEGYGGLAGVPQVKEEHGEARGGRDEGAWEGVGPAGQAGDGSGWIRGASGLPVAWHGGEERGGASQCWVPIFMSAEVGSSSPPPLPCSPIFPFTPQSSNPTARHADIQSKRYRV